MFREVAVLLLALFLIIFPILSYAETEEEATKAWLDALIESVNEQNPTKPPIYGSLDDKACTAAYVELEYVFQDTLKEARTDIYSSYFIVACMAAQEIEDTLYDQDSNIYQKVGRSKYLLSLDYLFGKNTDIESDEFKAAMEYVRRYFLQESNDACSAFYDDLIKFGYMDEAGNMDLPTQKYANELGISKGAIFAILEELNLYQTNPINGLKKDKLFDWVGEEDAGDEDSD